MRPPPVLKQESWTVKRSEHPQLKHQSEPSSLAKSLSESADPLQELDKRFPGFKKGPAYVRLEKQSRQLISKTTLLSQTFSRGLSSLRSQMQETREQLQSH